VAEFSQTAFEIGIGFVSIEKSVGVFLSDEFASATSVGSFEEEDRLEMPRVLRGAVASGFAAGSLHDRDGSHRHGLLLKNQLVKGFPLFPDLSEGRCQFGD